MTNSIVGPERLAKFNLILAGDVVKNKKPDPGAILIIEACSFDRLTAHV